MTRYLIRFGLTMTAVLELIGVPQARAQTAEYSIRDLGTLGGSRSVAWSVNSAGLVVGHSETADGEVHGFLYDGAMRDLGTLGGAESYAYRITDVGLVIGRAHDSTGLFRPFVSLMDGPLFDISALDARLRGPFSTLLSINENGMAVGYLAMGHNHNAARNRVFLYHNFNVTDLGIFRNQSGIVTAINALGQMAGYFNDEDEVDYADHRAFFAAGGTATVIPGLGGRLTTATDLNDSGDVIGFGQTAGGQPHAFRYQSGITADLGTLPGGSQSFAYAINNAGQIVGASDSTTRLLRAVIYAGGVMRDLNDLIPPNSGWILNEARDINSAGQIVGTGVVNGAQRAFLLTPVSR